MDKKKILEVENLRQHFRVGVGKKRIDVKAVDGLTFDIYENEVFGLVGESGCGKTTTGRSIIKLYKPTDGTVKFDGKIIGAGYSGNLRKIRLAKSEGKKAIIKADDYKNARYEIKTSYKEAINIQKELLKKHKARHDAKIKEVKSYNNNLSTDIAAVKSQINLEISQLEHEVILKVDEINKSMKKEIDHDYKISMAAANKRFTQKSSYLPESMLSKEEKEEQYEAFKNELKKETKKIEDIYLSKLDRYNPSKYISVAKKFYTKRLKKSKEPNIQEVIRKKISDLENYKPKEVASEMSSDEKKREVDKVQKDKRKKVEALKAKRQKQIAEINKKLKTKEVIQPQIDKIGEEYKNNVQQTKAKIQELKLEKKNKLVDLAKDRKANPNKYKVDKEKQKEIREEIKAFIKEQKAEIKERKRLNKIAETDEEREAQELKVKHIKASYEERVNKLENKIAELKSHHGEKDEESKELVDLRDELRELKIERYREVEKAKNANTYAGVMSQLQMIFQDPVSSLNPRKTVKEIISEGLIIQGIKDEEYIDRKVAEALNLVGLSPNHASRYPHEFSGGQRQRIGIARALIVNPKFIIADEPISALDVSIQAQIINLLKDLKDELGLTILFIAHDLSVVKYFSDRIAVMYFGKIVEQTTSKELFRNPLHPYTKSLLSAIPNPDPDSEKTRTRSTYDPRIHDYSVDKPEMVEIKPGHFIYANKAEVVQYKAELKKNEGAV